MPTETQILTTTELQGEIQQLRIKLSSMTLSNYERHAAERMLAELRAEFRRRMR